MLLRALFPRSQRLVPTSASRVTKEEPSLFRRPYCPDSAPPAKQDSAAEMSPLGVPVVTARPALGLAAVGSGLRNRPWARIWCRTRYRGVTATSIHPRRSLPSSRFRSPGRCAVSLVRISTSTRSVMPG